MSENADEPTVTAFLAHALVGAVLMQDHGNGGLQPVAFMSKVLNSAQSHYPTWEQELLALYLALEGPGDQSTQCRKA